MPQTLRLFDLFGAVNVTEALSRWPQAVRPETGIAVNWPPAGVDAWLDALNNGVTVTEVRTGALTDRVSIDAQLRLDNTAAGYPGGFPFVLASMPDVKFLIQHMSATDHVRLVATVSDAGADIVLEGVPVEIELPAGLFEPHPDVPGALSEDPAGNFAAGRLDGLRIVLRRDRGSSVFVHVRLHFTADGDVTIRPSVPISFGKCTFSGLPCVAVHGFDLIASPALASTEAGWIRHDVTPWAPDLVGPIDGCFSIRTVELDPTQDPIKAPLDWLRRQGGEGNPQLEPDTTVTVVGPDRTLTPEDRAAEPSAEFVLDDLVLPFWSPWVVPIPRHVTVGVRRRVIDPKSGAQVYAFDRAPVRAYFSFGPISGLIVESFFYRSLPASMADEDIGLTFDVSIVFGGSDREHDRSGNHALRIALGEQWTLVAGYRRDFDEATNRPASAGALNALLHWEIFNVSIDIMGFRLGYSIGRGVVEHASFGDSVEATADLWISKPPSAPNATFDVRSLTGESLAFAIEGIGWRLGSFQLSAVSAPDGVIFMFFDRFGVIIQEISVAAEQGASYLTFSGGLLLQIPSGFRGAFTFRRLRFRVAGDRGQPFLKVDGFFIYLETTGFYLEAGGYYKEVTDGTTQIKEFGLTGALQIGIGGAGFRFGLDLIIGSLRSPAEDFEYLLLQFFFRGSVAIALFELRGVRVLFARNMQPRLAPVDRESQNLRYYSWYKSTNPLTVPGDRRLAAWQPKGDAWALGVGADGSFANMGAAFAASVFVLGVSGPDEAGLLIVVEIMLLSSPKPVGFLALEFDFANGRFCGVLGVELTVKNFMRDAPDFLDRIAKLTGTLFVGNDPPTFAIGRLADERTWLQYRIDIDLWVRAFLMLGVCLELREGGPNGGGFVFRMEGQINGGVVAIRYNAGFGFTLAFFTTGSVDYALVIWIEAGVRVILFGFLRFGLSISADLRVVGADPTRGELTVTFRFETPWFLPDVTWTLECDWGDVRVADLATSTMPLLASGGTEGLTQKRAALHVERVVPTSPWTGDGPAPVFTINELRAAGSTEADRLYRFEHNADLRPVATDTTIAVSFAVSVNDLVGIGGTPAPDLGIQESGELTLTYDLVRIAVRRRSRFGSDRSWYVLEDRTELSADFSDPAGVTLTGAFLPAELFTAWDTEVRVEGQTATKQLLINTRTPFEFATESPETDEQVVDSNPSWPCCHGREKYRQWTIHEVMFRHEVLGFTPGGSRTFTDSTSRLHLPRPFIVRPPFATGLPASALVAAVPLAAAGIVWRAELTEDAAFCFVRLAVPAAGMFTLVAFDLDGAVVATVVVSGSAGGYQDITVNGSGPIRRLELRFTAPPQRPLMSYAVAPPQDLTVFWTLEVETDRVAYISLREYLGALREEAACDDVSDGFRDAYSGRGKLFLIPNHDYEVALTTRVTGAHPSRPPESVDVNEYVYLKTKGFPGLNAVGRVGEELQPYVRSAYAGGRGILYREEPVALQLSEDYSIALPLSLRPAGSASERSLLVRMQLLVDPQVALGPGTVFTATDPDWIVAHRTIVAVPTVTVWTAALSAGTMRAVAMTSIEPFRARLAALTQRTGATCTLPDPRDVTGTVLIAPPQGEADPVDASRELWPADAALAATVRLEHSGFVDRAVFESADQTAFAYARDAAAGGGAEWSVVDRRLRCTPAAERRFAIFGEPEWNHVTVQVEIVLAGAAAGVGVGLPIGGVPSRGLFSVIEFAGPGRRLAIYGRTAAGEWAEQAHAELVIDDPAAPISLTVTAFDDRLRASVGDVFVEADRGTVREGRLALVAQGDADFASLRVRGLSMYTFPVQTSRFRSFPDHIGSWSSRIDSIEPDALGSGTSSTSVAALWTADAAAIAAAMAPEGDPGERDRLFREWVAALGLPLKEDVTRLEVSRFAAAGGTTLFVLESPEPIDFTEEVAVRLTHRVRIGGGLVSPFPFDLAGWEIWSAARDRGERIPGIGGVRERAIQLRKDLFESQRAAAAPSPRPEIVPRPGTVIRDVIRDGDELRVKLQPATAAALGKRTGMLMVERMADDDQGSRARVYAPTAGAAPGAERETIAGRHAEDVSKIGRGGSLVPWDAIEALPEGSVMIIDPGRGLIVDWWPSSYTWDPIDVRVLQDRTGRRALLIPVNAGGALALAGGAYRLAFTLDRWRWSTTEPADASNHYHAEHTLSLTW